MSGLWRPLVAALAVLVVGCGYQPKANVLGKGEFQSTVMAKDGLTISVQAPSRQLTIGESVYVTVKAFNPTGKSIAIVSPSRELVKVRLDRKTPAGWETMREYPPMPQSALTPWTLAPHQERVWNVQVPVEPDWPTSEQLKLAVAVNGRPDAAASVPVWVTLPKVP